MDAKDLRTETALVERSNDGSSKFAHGVPALPGNANKTYETLSSNSLAKVETPTSRPCAVIGPDRVVPPPPTGDAYLKKGHFEPWLPMDNTYRQPPEYPHKMPSYLSPLGNISPRQTFQENMPRIMVHPTYNSKVNDDPSFISDRNMSKSSKINGIADPKYCDVPYSVNQINNDQKNTEMCVPNVNNTRNYPQMWHPPGVSMRPSRPYGAPELYQYPEYSNCAAPRPVPMARPHRTINEDPGHLYSDPYYHHESSIRYKPYPNIKERYPQTRYEFVSNYPNPFPAPHPYPYKYDMQKPLPPHPTHTQVPIKYVDNRVVDPVMDGYQRPTQGPYSAPYRNQVIHPTYSPMVGNNLPNKMYSYQSEGPAKPVPVPTNKLPTYDNKLYVDYDPSRNKGYPMPENFYDMRQHMKNQVIMPNFSAGTMQPMHPHLYYRKENMASKNFEYISHMRHLDPSLNPNSLTKLSSQFSPSSIAISPSDSNTSNDTSHTQGGSLEDCGYVSQSSTASIRSVDSGMNRPMHNDFHRRYNYAYQPPHRTSLMSSKPDITGPKNKKGIDVRQFLQMWNEGDEENAGNSKEAIAQPDHITNKPISQYEVAKNNEQLYVLGLTTVPSEELGKYEHIQKVSKLPENIKGYNSIELLKHFEEAIESSNLNPSNQKLSNQPLNQQPVPRNYNLAAKNPLLQALPPRPLSPLDVEAKISQSVIHKEVGCNFEIKPCSPEMLNVQVATPAQNILNERTIEKVSNPMVIKPSLISGGSNESTCNVMRHNELSLMLNENNKIPSCELLVAQCSNTDTTNAVKTNYSFQDLESNAGVCLASLPRLDNDIELSFPEVNQQFINANKKESVITTADTQTKPNNDHFKTDRSGDDHEYSPKVFPTSESDKECSKLSKFRKIKKSDGASSDKSVNSNSQCLRTDSVIIKNPENTKSVEFPTETQSHDKKKADCLLEISPNSHSFKMSCIANECDVSNEIALDFSLNKIEDNSLNESSQNGPAKKLHINKTDDNNSNQSTSPGKARPLQYNAVPLNISTIISSEEYSTQGNNATSSSFSHISENNTDEKQLKNTTPSSNTNHKEFPVNENSVSQESISHISESIDNSLNDSISSIVPPILNTIENSFSEDSITQTFTPHVTDNIECKLDNISFLDKPQRIISKELSISENNDNTLNNTTSSKITLTDPLEKKIIIENVAQTPLTVNDTSSSNILIASKKEENSSKEDVDQTLALHKLDDTTSSNELLLTSKLEENSVQENNVEQKLEPHISENLDSKLEDCKLSCEPHNVITKEHSGNENNMATIESSNTSANLDNKSDNTTLSSEALIVNPELFSSKDQNGTQLPESYILENITDSKIDETTSSSEMLSVASSEECLKVEYKVKEMSTHHTSENITTVATSSRISPILVDAEDLINVPSVEETSAPLIEEISSVKSLNGEKVNSNDDSNIILTQKSFANAYTTIDDTSNTSNVESTSGYQDHEEIFELKSTNDSANSDLSNMNENIASPSCVLSDSQEKDFTNTIDTCSNKTFDVCETDINDQFSTHTNIASLERCENVNSINLLKDEHVVLESYNDSVTIKEHTILTKNLDTPSVLQSESNILKSLGPDGNHNSLSIDTKALNTNNILTKNNTANTNKEGSSSAGSRFDKTTEDIVSAKSACNMSVNSDYIGPRIEDKDISNTVKMSCIDTPSYSPEIAKDSEYNNDTAFYSQCEEFPSISTGEDENMVQGNSETIISTNVYIDAKCLEKPDHSIDIEELNESDNYVAKSEASSNYGAVNEEKASFCSELNIKQHPRKETFLRKHLMSPWIQKLVMKNEGKCLVNTGYDSETSCFEISDVVTSQDHESEEESENKNIELQKLFNNSTDHIHVPSPESLEPFDENSFIDPMISNNNKLCNIDLSNEHDDICEESITITADSGIYEIETETTIPHNSNDFVDEHELNLPFQSGPTHLHCEEDSIERSLNQIHAEIPVEINQSILERSNITLKRSLKRSLSDSALDMFNNNTEDMKKDDSIRCKIPKKSNRAFLNVFNIQNNRRNSISSVHNEENMSFCIVIGNNCIISEENEEDEKICYDITEQCFATIHEDSVNEDGMESTNEIILCPQDDDFVEPLILEVSDEKTFEESWVDDVACVETVVSDDIAEDIVVSGPSSPRDIEESDSEEPDVFNCTSEHTEKVKFIYGDKMCNDDAELVETLYRTPQMDVNRTLINREPHIGGECNTYEKDSVEETDSGSYEILGNKREFHCTEDDIYGNKINNDIEENNTTCHKLIDNDKEENNTENDINISLTTPCLIAESKPIKTYEFSPNACSSMTQNDDVNSCESCLDDALFSSKYDENHTNQTAFSSPEVSSTTTEEKNSSILLKITNYKGTRMSQLSDLSLNRTNSNSCRFTENVNYASYQSNSTNPRPLITKAAQKYIPPAKETVVDNLKVKLPLPSHSLNKYKELKKSRNELRRNSIKNKDVQKKPKPRFEDVLKSIDEIQYKRHKDKSKKPKESVPKVVIKKNVNGSHYASRPTKETFNPDLTGRKWQPWVFIEKNGFIDKMAIRKKNKAIFNHRKNTFVLAEKFKKYKAIPSAKFVISKPKLDDSSSGQFKYTIRLKHSY